MENNLKVTQGHVHSFKCIDTNTSTNNTIGKIPYEFLIHMRRLISKKLIEGYLLLDSMKPPRSTCTKEAI